MEKQTVARSGFSLVWRRRNQLLAGKCFIKVIECLQYLARQGQAMQGDTDDESNFIQLLKLRGKDKPLL